VKQNPTHNTHTIDNIIVCVLQAASTSQVVSVSVSVGGNALATTPSFTYNPVSGAITAITPQVTLGVAG